MLGDVHYVLVGCLQAKSHFSESVSCDNVAILNIESQSLSIFITQNTNLHVFSRSWHVLDVLDAPYHLDSCH